MASYQQTIELVVRGEEQLKKLQNRVTALNKEVDRLKDPTTKAGTGVLADIAREASAEQKKYNNEVGRTLLNQIKLNSAVDLYERRLKAVYTTAAPGQKQFQDRLAEISQAFNVFKDQKNVQGVQAVATELGRIVEYSNEVNRAEVARVKSAGRLQGYIAEINRLRAAGVDVSKAENTLEKLKVDLGTNRFRQAGALEARFRQRLNLLIQEEKQLKKIQAEENKRAKSTKTGTQSALESFGAFGLGGGFPLLFGGGAGQVAGGLLGTAIAKSFGLAGEAAMGLQIALSAILGKVEELITRFTEVGNAVRSIDMDALANTFITINENARTLTRQLIEAGNAQDAVSVAARETALQTGVLPEATSDITNNVNLLSNTWDEVVGSVSGLVSIIATPFVTALTLVLQLVSKITQGVNVILSVIGLVIKKIAEALFQLPGLKQILEFIKENTKGTVEEQEKGLAVLKKSGEELTREYNQNVALTKIEMKRTAGRTAAEKLVNAEIDKRMGLKKLEFDTEDKIRETRLKFANETSEAAQVELAYQEQIIKQNAKVEKYKINQTFELAKQNIELEAQKEKEKELEELAKKRSEKYKEMAEDVKLQTQLLTDQAESLNYQSTITNNIANLNNARRQTESDLLDLQIGRLERQKDEAKHFLDKIKLNNIIIDKRKEQAKLEYESQLTSIKLSVSKAEQERIQIRLKEQQIKLQLEQVRLEAEAIQDADRRNAALNRINQQEKSTLQVVKDMNRAADHSLETTRKIASFQEQSAKYAYQGKIEALETARQQERMAIFLNSQKGSMNSLASQSGTYASNMERAANAAKKQSAYERGELGATKTFTVSTGIPIDADIKQKIQSQGGFKSPEEMVSAMVEAQRNKNRNMAIEQRRNELTSSPNKLATSQSQYTNALESAGRMSQLAEKYQPLAESLAQRASAFAKGGYVTGPHIGMVGEAGPEYIVPERKAAAFATNYLMGARGAGAIPQYADGGYVGPINIQTGPVMQQDNERYVTMGQFEAGMRSVVNSMVNNRNYGARRYRGVS